MAHIAGLVAAGLHPSPVPHADLVTTTTHKTLRGPRGGLILGKAEQEKAVNSAVFPGLQGGPLMHVIAAKAVALGEALGKDFRRYQEQVLENARVLAMVLQERGLRIVSGGTDSHMFLVDLRAKKITGKDAEAALSMAHITCNKNAIPNDPEKPFVTSGIRLGSPAITTRGFTEIEKPINSAVFPGLQGGPLMHVIAAKAVALREALGKDFRSYQEQVLDNARVLATVLQERGLRIVSGGTDSHMFLVDLRAKRITGKDAEAALSKAHITCNKNAIPNDPEKPFVTSGIRIGSPAITTRGFTELESEELAHLVADVLDAPGDAATIEHARTAVRALTQKFPVYG